MTQARSTSFFAWVGLAAAALVLAGALAAGPSFAASEPSGGGGGGGGGSGGGGGGGSSGASGTPDCATGKVWDKTKDKCVTKESSAARDKRLYNEGRALAIAGKYEKALTTLARIKNQKDAKVLTMIGYSKRKLGDVDAGMAIYQQAIALDPNNLYTIEYLGEGYLQKGDIDSAELQLAKLEKLCGKTCEQYRDLSKAIAGEPNQTWDSE